MKTAAFVVGLIGGIIALLGMLLLLALAGTANYVSGSVGGAVTLEVALLFLDAIGILVCSALVKDTRGRMAGVMLVGLSVVGLLLAQGFFIGGVLSLVAGILALADRSVPPVAQHG